MVTMDNKENPIVTSEFLQQATLEQLVEEFYKVKKAISLIEVPTASKTKGLSEKKHAIGIHFRYLSIVRRTYHAYRLVYLR